jgi:hypothetical protein
VPGRVIGKGFNDALRRPAIPKRRNFAVPQWAIQDIVHIRQQIIRRR